MQTALIASALLMGLAGTPHCIAMCGPACTALTRRRGPAAGFHLTRALGYSLAGAVAASSVAALNLLGQLTPALRPLWTLVHAAALALGVWLMWHGRQPGWVERIGRGRQPAAATGDGWQPVQGPSRHDVLRSGVAGLAWVAWPCGLLQSALVVAALANTPLGGALVMGSFAAASSVGLIAGPLVWWRLAGRLQGTASAEAVSAWSIRLAGAMLAAASGWALSHGLWERFAAWCVS